MKHVLGSVFIIKGLTWRSFVRSTMEPKALSDRVRIRWLEFCGRTDRRTIVNRMMTGIARIRSNMKWNGPLVKNVRHTWVYGERWTHKPHAFVCISNQIQRTKDDLVQTYKNVIDVATWSGNIWNLRLLDCWTYCLWAPSCMYVNFMFAYVYLSNLSFRFYFTIKL